MLSLGGSELQGATFLRASASTDQSLDAIVVTAWKTNRLAGVRIDWNLPQDEEQRWAVLPGNRIEYLGIAMGKSQRNGSVQVSVPNLVGLQAIIHTHPYWSEPVPGILDYGHNIPIYGLEPNGAWVIEPNAKNFRCLVGFCN
jgi:hypothetical protein